MSGAVVGLFVIVLGLAIAPTGLYFLQICYAVVGLAGFYIGIQSAATAPPVASLQGVPLGKELAYGVAAGGLSMFLLALVFGIAAVVLPISYGLHLGAQLFFNPLLVYLTTIVVALAGCLLFWLGIWVASAVVGGVLAAVGVQFVFAVAEKSAPPYNAIAEWLRSADVPTLLPDTIAAIGAIGRSGLLFGIAAIVAIFGIVGHLFILSSAEEPPPVT